MSESSNQSLDSHQVAEEIAAAIDAAGCEYALGGAIALGFWATPRGTVDVDVTLFLSPKQPSSCARTLQAIGCKFRTETVMASLTEHGFCQVEYGGRRVDVFLPTMAFYEHAKSRRQQVSLGKQAVTIWDAETLCVFKIMFFRSKDMADVEELLRVQGGKLDRAWVRLQIVEIYGERDPRVSRWDELVSETPASD